MTGVSVTKTAELFGVTRSTLSKVMTAFEKEGKTSTRKQNSGRKWKLSDRDCWTLSWIVQKDYKKTAPKITAELNDNLDKLVSSKVIWRKLHKAGFHGGCPRGVMVKAMDSEIVVSEFVLQSHYDVHFRTNTLGERYEPPYLPSYGLNSTTTVLQGDWLWH